MSARQTIMPPSAGDSSRRSPIESQSVSKELPAHAPMGLSAPLMATHEWLVTHKGNGPKSEGLVDDNLRTVVDTTQRGPTEG
ncbi:hypothetical protein N7520_006853 [Penicillium odoratum]|uniref:uncharacterized protein n=1 Tax=Penicillium odoratum TaxID=1167516 RepID=UPI002549A4D9|nr:uncharacterized protein N7520_006853 [Penicillium odoratum]KAJ5759697.1 hypothetical protein N7520_006853 [Penicillium odoratum]